LCHILFGSPDIARGSALLIYTLAGITGLFLKNAPKLRRASTFLLSGVILRLLFIEVWNMTLLVRMVIFLSIGTLLLISAFANRNPKSAQKPEAA
jgi:uncharacterized membrane protein